MISNINISYDFEYQYFMAGGSWKGPQKILNNTRDVILIKMLETWAFLPSAPSRSLQQLFNRKPLASDFFLASPAAAVGVFWFNWFSQLVCVDFTLCFGTVASAGLLAGGNNGFAGLAFVPQLFRFVSVNVDAGDVGVVGDANWLASAAAGDWKVTVWEGGAGVEAEAASITVWQLWSGKIECGFGLKSR